MSYFIFGKKELGYSGGPYKIAENLNDLNNLNIDQSNYKIIEDSQENFNAVKLQIKGAIDYQDNTVIYEDINAKFTSELNLKNYIQNLNYLISSFLENNKNHPKYNIWDSYANQLKNLDTKNIVYPLNKSLEQYFNDLGQPSYNILQLP